MAMQILLNSVANVRVTSNSQLQFKSEFRFEPDLMARGLIDA